MRKNARIKRQQKLQEIVYLRTILVLVQLFLVCLAFFTETWAFEPIRQQVLLIFIIIITLVLLYIERKLNNKKAMIFQIGIIVIDTIMVIGNFLVFF